MFQKKSTNAKIKQDKTLLDNVLWFIENYLPQKKKRASYSEFPLDEFESFTIKKIKNLAATRSKSLEEDLSNAKLTFTVGIWALPYLNLLKRIKLLR
tara:strand:- start:348 stop:638 length:291 start_codon:yes stop_codon:yes gene_type:complete